MTMRVITFATLARGPAPFSLQAAMREAGTAQCAPPLSELANSTFLRLKASGRIVRSTTFVPNLGDQPVDLQDIEDLPLAESVLLNGMFSCLWTLASERGHARGARSSTIPMGGRMKPLGHAPQQRRSPALNQEEVAHMEFFFQNALEYKRIVSAE